MQYPFGPPLVAVALVPVARGWFLLGVGDGRVVVGPVVLGLVVVRRLPLLGDDYPPPYGHLAADDLFQCGFPAVPAGADDVRIPLVTAFTPVEATWSVEFLSAIAGELFGRRGDVSV